MLRCFVLISASVCVSVAKVADDEVLRQFQIYIKEYDKHYDSSEMEERLASFSASYHFILSENAKNRSFRLGLNSFSDMSQEKFVSTRYSQRHANETILNGLPMLGMHEPKLGT